MAEDSIVRQNMIDNENYRPYCMKCSGLQRMNMRLDNLQLQCPKCITITSFPSDFIDRYKTKHNLK